MAYDSKKNQICLERMLKTAERFGKGFPELWGVYEAPKAKAKGLPIVSACKNMDATEPTTFVEIRREANGSFRFYDYFDGEGKESSAERIAAKLGEENAAGWVSSDTFTPEYLAGEFNSKMKKYLDILLTQDC